MSSKDQDRCAVCDDVAIGMNFGVPTCMPCKAFFRRNALRRDSTEFVCKNNGNCTITYKYRRSCNCCRLAKCFHVGMKKTLILSDEERVARNNLVLENRLKRGKIPKRQCVKWMQPPSLLPIGSNSVRSLSSSDQTVLANIFNAYEITCISTSRSEFPNYFAHQQTKCCEFLNEAGSIVRIAIEYLKLIPEFMRINIDDQIRLIKNHVGDMMNINEKLMFPMTPSNLIITWTNLFGVHVTSLLLKRNRILEQYQHDPILLKLVFIVLILSSDDSRNIDVKHIDKICDDSLGIFAAQNIYVELLWRYILYRSSSEVNAVKIFNKLVMFILFIKSVDNEVERCIEQYTTEIQKVEPMMQSMFITSDTEENSVDI